MNQSEFYPVEQIGVGGFKLSVRERENVLSVLDSNRLSYGPWSKKFESLFAAEHECVYAVFSNSGTSALQMALAVLKEKYGWKDGDEVIVPAVTFIATSNIVLFNRMTPVFVDVDSKTYNIDPSKIEEALTERTRAIMPVHLFGLPCDMTAVNAIARRHNLRIIEDSCETMFASCDGKSVGSFGEVGCFSTYMAHFIVTGVGGLATTNDPDLAVMMRSYMNHGRDSIYLNIDDDKNVRTQDLSMIISKRFSFVRLGHSMRATELEAAIGVGQLEQKNYNITKRAENALFYSESFADLSRYLQLPTVPAGRDHRYMMYPLVLLSGSKKHLVEFLESRFIETRDMLPLTNQPYYADLFGEDFESRFAVARWINQNGFYIGCHPYLTRDEIEYVSRTLHEYFESHAYKQ